MRQDRCPCIIFRINKLVMESILQRLDRRMYQEKQKVILFWDNVTCHPETAQAGLKIIKLVFLPKNTTSQSQPLDAGIIRNFKHKHRKLLVRYVVSRVDEGKTVSQIIEEVHRTESDHLALNRMEECSLRKH